ncbi:putative phosphoglycerate mutase pmu1 [Recurvomyces mirabilis]|nr:putative phosphoglycerate mutase pmu1 [Recurvomyces mirabilis]
MPDLSKTGLRRIATYLSAIFISLLAIWYLLSAVTPTRDTMGSTGDLSYDYATVKGFFLQDDAATDPATFDYSKHNFGLIDRAYPSDSATLDAEKRTQWQRFSARLKHMIETAPTGTTYKLFYLGRHGEGDHNVAEAFYGTKAWDDYWSKLDGNGTVIWSDAHLTAVGEEQARKAGAFLGEQFAFAKMPEPERWYVSPLTRCLQTCDLTWSGLKLHGEHLFKPIIKEFVREVMGEHTCDRRSTRTIIHETAPKWTVEDGFAENDELWQANHRETWAEHDIRTRALLDDLFAHDSSSVLSVTAHSGTIASLLRVTGHRKFPLPTGGMIPLFVKATKAS